MAKEKLTETQIKKLKHSDKQFKLSDGRGLYLLVHPNGSKYWRFDFRFNGKQKSSSLGVWPDVSLSKARAKRNTAKMKINEGVNPIDEKRRSKTLDDHNLRKNEGLELGEKEKYDNYSYGTVGNETFLKSKRKKRIVVDELLVNVLSGFAEKEFSEINKQDVVGIFKSILDNRKKILKIVWKIYPSYPIIQLGVLFILLLFITGIFSALITTFLYFFFSVCFAVGYVLWNDE